MLLLLLLSILAMASVAMAETNVTIAWDANSESDLAGYRVYRGESSGTYAMVGDVPLASLADPGSPQFVNENLPDATYYWVVTAYDTENNESGYSNEVSKKLDTTAPGIPAGVRIEITVKIVIGGGS